MELLLTQVINDSNEILIPVEMFIDNKGFVNKIYLITVLNTCRKNNF